MSAITRNIAAGLLMYRITAGLMEFFLAHPGGPFFKNKETGAWTLPKGAPEQNEDLLDTAVREFFEETGIQPIPPFHRIGRVRQKGGKVVHAWAFEGRWQPETGIRCNTFALEWPPRSGKVVHFPEIDKAAWMTYEQAVKAILPEQVPFLNRVMEIGNPTQQS